MNVEPQKVYQTLKNKSYNSLQLTKSLNINKILSTPALKSNSQTHKTHMASKMRKITERLMKIHSSESIPICLINDSQFFHQVN